ncbi:MAG: hypothetical protein CL917_16590 [Deltaproteobacteria bacterium]|nr:hypothetical protein [Deltaproteobacteria bacterium]
MRKVFLWVGLIVLGWSAGASALPVNNPITSGLVAAYEFSGNADDSSGSGNDGVANGATPTVDRFGNANSAYFFDGLQSTIQLSSHVVGLTEFSYSVWVNYHSNSPPPGAPDAWRDIVMTGVVRIGFIEDGNIRADVYADRSGGMTTSPSTRYMQTLDASLTRDSWTHLVINGYSDNSIDAYVNGNVVNSSLFVDGGVTGDAVNSAIGSNAHHVEHEFFGVIDDVYIYDRALSASEVQTLYSAVPEPSTALFLGLGLAGMAAARRRVR